MKFLTLLLATFFSLHSSETNYPRELAIHSTHYQTPYRFLTNKDPQGLSIEMDDGAIWRIIDSSSAEEVKYWRIEDPLIIYPTLLPSWSGGRYFILNERLSSTAIAEISYGPLLGKSTHNQITYMDYATSVIQIQDDSGRASFFRLNSKDRNLFQYWKLGQTIIIGSNENCYAGWFSNNPYILINVERNDYVRATPE